MITEQTRFDARISKAQKAFFEKAMTLGGFRSLTEFIFQSAQEKAEEIMKRHNTIIASNQDREIFFNALINPPEPNQALKDAMKEYLSATK